jgi:hypothetical protein
MKFILLVLTSVTDYGRLNYGIGSVTLHKPGSTTAYEQEIYHEHLPPVVFVWSVLMDNVQFSYFNLRYDDSQTQVTHKHKLSTWKKYTTLNNTRHTTNIYAVWFYIPRHQNLRACLTLVIQAGKFHHYHSDHATRSNANRSWTAAHNTRATTSL